jgi:methylenetetrahydrofolate dehydrogenase (NADP+) / methenyltetrahydrofolate cyclohydrolase
MSATVIDGRKVAMELRTRLADDLVEAVASGARVGLATVLVGDSSSAEAYERSLANLAASLGCPMHPERLPADAELDDVLGTIGKLNSDSRISGILILRPLPAHIPEDELYRLLDPAKDVEAVTEANAGLMARGTPRFVTSTPASVFQLLDHYLRQVGRDPASWLVGRTVTVVGRSHNVGRPALWLALDRGATIVGCDKHTSDAGRLAEFTVQADVLIVAAGVPGLVTGDMVRDGVIALDVGITSIINPETGKRRLVGDLDFPSVAARAEAITPVPGGVGPVTDVWLIRNTIAAAVGRHGGHPPAPWTTS